MDFAFTAQRDFWISLLQWAIYTDALRLTSALMYVIFAAGIWDLGTRYQAALVHKHEPPRQFPTGYFTMLSVQLIPLTITGFVLHDVYIIATRLGTLVVVLLVKGMISTPDGTYHTGFHRRHLLIWLSIAIMGPMIWISSESLRVFVHDWEKWISYSAVAVMVLFVVKGQFEVAKALFKHFFAGNYTVKRLRLQVVRFFGFLLQALHYALAPVAIGGTIDWLDPIFLQGALGAIGVTGVLIAALYGWIRGHSRENEVVA